MMIGVARPRGDMRARSGCARVVAMIVAVCVGACGARSARDTTREAQPGSVLDRVELASLGSPWLISEPGDINAVVLVRALAGSMQVGSWLGYARWDGAMPAAFIGEVHEGEIDWDQGGSPGEVRIGVGLDGSGGLPLTSWMAMSATRVAVAVMPGGLVETVEQCRVALPDDAGAPIAALPGASLPAQARALLSQGDRDRLRSWIVALHGVEDMEQLLTSLELLARRGILSDLVQYIGDGKAPKVKRRLETAALLVDALQCQSLTLELLTGIARGAELLDEKDRLALIAYMDHAVGLEDEADAAVGATAGRMDPDIEAAIAASMNGISVPAGPMDPPGETPRWLYIGNEVHRAIRNYYRAARPLENVMPDERSIATLLAFLAQLGIGPAKNLELKAEGELRLRPDIVNLSTGEIYEIKSWPYEVQGEVKAKLYIDIFARHGVRMRLGTSGVPGTFGVISAPGGHVIFHSPRPGVIVYHYALGPFPPPEPVPQKQERPVIVRLPGMDTRMVEATGKTGTALAFFYMLLRAAKRRAERAAGFLFIPEPLISPPRDDKA